MKRYSLIIWSLLVFTGCKKAYNPPVLQQANNYLVVDGFINLNPGEVTRITLSRSRNLSDTVISIPEYFANMSIESSAGWSAALRDPFTTGTYSSDILNLNSSEQYRLRIRTLDNHEYLSDFVTPKEAPPIDSLTWKQDGDVTIYLDGHDPNNSTRYYKWDFIETWEYRARQENFLDMVNGRIFYTDRTTQIFTCWATANSNTIITGNSSALSDDVISHAPITKILKDDDRIKVRYSILVRQLPLTLEAYNYWVIIQKNSQQLGTLFDLQPSQLRGNIHSETDASEPVIGYVTAAAVTQRRLFIGHGEVTDWSTNVPVSRECTIRSIATNPADIYIYTYPDPDYAPYYFGDARTLFVIPRECIDCRLRGGTNSKPSFW